MISSRIHSEYTNDKDILPYAQADLPGTNIPIFSQSRRDLKSLEEEIALLSYFLKYSLSEIL